MPVPDLAPTDILRIIQAAVAPVVLMSGVGLLLNWNVGLAAALLFVASMLSLVAAMLVFVRELFHALTALSLTLEEPGH